MNGDVGQDPGMMGWWYVEGKVAHAVMDVSSGMMKDHDRGRGDERKVESKGQAVCFVGIKMGQKMRTA